MSFFVGHLVLKTFNIIITMLGYLQCKSLKYSPEKIFKICSNFTFFFRARQSSQIQPRSAQASKKVKNLAFLGISFQTLFIYSYFCLFGQGWETVSHILSCFSYLVMFLISCHVSWNIIIWFFSWISFYH